MRFHRLLESSGADVVLSDVNLKGELTGGDLLARIRNQFRYGKGELPVLIMTGDDNPLNQAKLPVDEHQVQVQSVKLGGEVGVQGRPAGLICRRARVAE